MGWDYFERAPRRAVKDGVKARSRNFAEQWWAKRWIQALEAFGWDNRLRRGRTYARAGQVVDCNLASGEIKARVQGSRPKPYEVKIGLKGLSAAAWEAALDRMAGRAEFAANLLSGQMPQNIEEAFDGALLPARGDDLKMSCSCPDYAVPCKHIAAVHYIVAEELDQDPFVLFSLRGRGREEILEALRKRRGTGLESDGAVEEAPAALEALPEDAESFWNGAPLPYDFEVGLGAPRVRSAVLMRLGAPGPWTTVDEFIRVVGPVLARVSEAATRMAAGERGTSGAGPVDEVPVAVARKGSTRAPRREEVAMVPTMVPPRRGPGRPRKSEAVAVAPVQRRRPGRPRKSEAVAVNHVVPRPARRDIEVVVEEGPSQGARRRPRRD